MYGIPDRLTMDNGREIASNLNKKLYNSLGIYVTHIAPLSPSGNLIEQRHKYLKEMFQISGAGQDDWSYFLTMVLYGLNNLPMPNLSNFSPFEVLFLRENKSPFDVVSYKSKTTQNWLSNFSTKAAPIFAKVADGYRARFDALSVFKSGRLKS